MPASTDNARGPSSGSPPKVKTLTPRGSEGKTQKLKSTGRDRFKRRG
jgi:hypothetical protein